MKRLLLILCAAMALVSCEKVNLGLGDGEVTPKGNLVVRVFKMDNTPFSPTTRSPVGDVCSRLNYALYGADGSRVKQVNQQSADDGYGTASFQMDAGEYLLVVVGHSSNGNPTMTDATKIQFTNSTGYSDTFLYAANVTIGDAPQELDVTLDRIVSLCRFVVTDDFPADVHHMQFFYTGGSGAFDARTGLGSVNSKQTVTYDVTEGQKEFDLYTFLHDEEGSIDLRVTTFDAAGTQLAERQFTVPLRQNRITWLSGAFFDGYDPSVATVAGISVNDEWDGEEHLTY